MQQCEDQSDLRRSAADPWTSHVKAKRRREDIPLLQGREALKCCRTEDGGYGASLSVQSGGVWGEECEWNKQLVLWSKPSEPQKDHKMSRGYGRPVRVLSSKTRQRASLRVVRYKSVMQSRTNVMPPSLRWPQFKRGVDKTHFYQLMCYLMEPLCENSINN